MQTFLPYPDFTRSAEVLDARRLGKQRVEALQVVRALTYEGYGWQHHPVTAMWRGHVEALGAYALAVVDRWRALGFADTCEATIRTDLAAVGIEHVRDQQALAAAGELPPWLGDEAVHRSHRSALLRKDPDVYRAVFPDDPDDLPYCWPVPPGGTAPTP